MGADWLHFSQLIPAEALSQLHKSLIINTMDNTKTCGDAVNKDEKNLPIFWKPFYNGGSFFSSFAQ